MTQKYHFISGLPRSGSTLLSGILRQNPRFHAAISSPVAGLMNGALEQMGANSESYSFFDENKRKAISKALFQAYYSDTSQAPLFLIPTGNGQPGYTNWLSFFDDFKVICCVRNPAWVMDSFEKIYRKNPFDYSRMFSPRPGKPCIAALNL